MADDVSVKSINCIIFKEKHIHQSTKDRIEKIFQEP